MNARGIGRKKRLRNEQLKTYMRRRRLEEQQALEGGACIKAPRATQTRVAMKGYTKSFTK